MKITYVAIGISVNPATKDWDSPTEYNQRIIAYYLRYGDVFGGSGPMRKVKKVKKDSNGYYPGGDFKMELDLSNRRFGIEIDGEKIIIDKNIGNLQYSPIVLTFDNDILSESEFNEIKLI